MSRKRSLILAAILCLVLSSLAAGQIKLTGDITGLVVDETAKASPESRSRSRVPRCSKAP